MNIKKITNIVSIIIGVLAIVFLILIISKGDDNIEMDAMNGDYVFVSYFYCVLLFWYQMTLRHVYATPVFHTKGWNNNNNIII